MSQHHSTCYPCFHCRKELIARTVDPRWYLASQRSCDQGTILQVMRESITKELRIGKMYSFNPLRSNSDQRRISRGNINAF